jgi:opacity protein-like surface antigen
MRKSVLAVLVCVLTAWSAEAYAQVHNVAIVPFGGYRWGGGLNSITGVRKFDTQNTWSYGVALDFDLSYSSDVEIYYSHFSGDWNADLTAGGKISGSLNRDDIMVNGIWYATRSGMVLRPYFTAGLGVSIYSADNVSATGRFAWNIGAGLRHDFSDNLALRLDGRWIPTWFTTGTGVYCDPYYFYGCYPLATGEFYDQFELTLGLLIKL